MEGQELIEAPSFSWRRATAGDLMERWRAHPAEFVIDPTAQELDFEEILSQVDVEQACAQGYAAVRREDGTRDVWVVLKLGDYYDVLGAYKDARARNRMSKAVHARFWKIRHGNLGMAVEFWEQFGGLEHRHNIGPHGDEGDYGWFSLAEFWRKHHRFQLITKLWVTLDDLPALRRSWRELNDHIDEINRAEFFSFGCQPKGELPSHGLRVYPELPWALPDMSFEGWLEKTNDLTLQKVTTDLIGLELNSQLRKAPRWWPQGTGRPSFEPVFVNSLWATIWQLFAIDTKTRGWRICPHCGKLFYPPREDRRYCTSALQVQYSKARWWEEHKEQELKKRKAERRRTTR